MSEMKCDAFCDGKCSEDGCECVIEPGEKWEWCPDHRFNGQWHGLDGSGERRPVTPEEDGTPSVSEADSLCDCASLTPIPDGTGEPAENTGAEEEPGGGELRVVWLDAGLIDAHPDNPRKNVGDVTELADSIGNEGIQQPLTVVPHIGGHAGRYTCVIGHRRLAAAQAAGLDTVPAFVRQMNRREQLRTMMTENTQRRDLTPLEEADGFKQLMLELPEQTAAAVARETGFSETTVRRRLKLHELPRETVEIAEERGGVRLSDYERLNEIKSPERRAEAARELGTSRFLGTVQLHVDREKKEEKFDKLVEKVRAKGAGEAASRKELSSNQELEYAGGVRSWRLDDTLPKFERGREYFFAVDRASLELDIYCKKRPADAEGQEEKSDADKAKEELKTRTEELMEELRSLLTEQEAVDQELRSRREEYVKGLQFQRHREEIVTAAVLMLIRGSWWSEGGLAELGNWLGLEEPLGEISNARLCALVRGNPEKALLYTLYCKAERDAPGWHTTEYWNGQRYRKYSEQPKGELLYDVLRELGYQMSGEELLLRGGAHHLQGQAEKLIGQYRKEKREIEKRINV